MTSSPDDHPERPGSERDPASVVPKRMSGLTVAALAIGVFTLVATIAAWGALLITAQWSTPVSFGGFSYTPLNQQADLLPVPSYPDFVALASIAWLAVLPTASTGLVFVRASRLRDASDGPVLGLRASTLTAVIALVLAIAGLVLLYVVTGQAITYRVGG